MSDTPSTSLEAPIEAPIDPPIVFELALYRVHDADTFAARQHELHAAARGFDGYLTSWQLRADTPADVFADLVQWRDVAAAGAAAEQFGRRPDLAWVGDAMAEMLFFGHLHTHDGHPVVATDAA